MTLTITDVLAGVGGSSTCATQILGPTVRLAVNHQLVSLNSMHGQTRVSRRHSLAGSVVFSGRAPGNPTSLGCSGRPFVDRTSDRPHLSGVPSIHAPEVRDALRL